MTNAFSTDTDYGDFNVLPEGGYTLRIWRVIIGETANKKPCADLFMQVLDGEHRGYWFRDRLMLIATKYGFGRLQELCKVLGVKGRAQDPDGLDPFDVQSMYKLIHNRPFRGKTKNTKWTSDQKSGVNIEVVKFRKLEAGEFDDELPPLPEKWNEDWDGVPQVGPGSDRASSAGSDDGFNEGFSDDDIPF